MNWCRHLKHKPIVVEIEMWGGIGILEKCPKCKQTLELGQKKCECGCWIRRDEW